MKRFASIALAAAIALAGCGGEIAAHDDSLVSFTMVKLHADGNHEVDEQWITRAEQRARVDAQLRAGAQTETGVGRAAEAITNGGTNGTCPTGSIGLSDQSNYGGNYICFWGSGTAVLQNFCRVRRFTCSATWSVATRSYISGNENGYFEDGQFNVSTFTHNNFVPTLSSSSVPYQSVILGLTE